MRAGSWLRLAALAAVLALPVSGCTSVAPPQTESGTSAATSSSDGPTATAASSPSSSVGAIPRIELLTEVPGGGTGSIPRDELATLVAQQLGDASSASVQTVVCDGDLPVGDAGSTTCVVSAQDGTRAADESWHAYATRNPGGTRAVLLLNGDPLTDEFVQVLAQSDAYTTTASIDPAYGTSDLDAAHVQQDAQGVLRRADTDARLAACQGALSFSSFTPVVCSGTAGGAPARVIVLPGSFMADAPGLMVVVQPGG